MKKVTVTADKYEADDGQQFDKKYDCKFHELKSKLKAQPYYLVKIKVANCNFIQTTTVMARLSDDPYFPFIIEDLVYDHMTSSSGRKVLSTKKIRYSDIVSVHKISVGEAIDIDYCLDDCYCCLDETST